MESRPYSIGVVALGRKRGLGGDPLGPPPQLLWHDTEVQPVVVEEELELDELAELLMLG
jgi:hypothetical protein